MVAKIWAVTIPVAIKPYPPSSVSRKAQAIAIVGAINDNYIIPCPAVIPTMEGYNRNGTKKSSKLCAIRAIA
nr:hypothetical protein [Nostoc sp. FACHB-888]